MTPLPAETDRESTNQCNIQAHLPDTPRGIARVYNWAALLTGCTEDRFFYKSYGGTSEFLSRFSPNPVSRDSVRRGIERLCELGMFVKLEKPGPKGTNQYRVLNHDQWATAHPNQCWIWVQNDLSKSKAAKPTKAAPDSSLNTHRSHSDSVPPDTSETRKDTTTAQMVVGNPGHNSLMADLARVCDKEAEFTWKHQSNLADFCNEFSVEEVVSAFKEYWSKPTDPGKPVTPYLAAENFVANAKGWIQEGRNRRGERQREEAAREVTVKRLRAEAEAESRRIKEREREEAELFDPLAG